MRRLNMGMLVLAFGLLPAAGCGPPQYPYYGYYGYGALPAPYLTGFPYPTGVILARRQELRLTRRQQARLRGIHERFRRENAADLARARGEMESFRARYGRVPDSRDFDQMLSEQRYPRLFQNMRATRAEALQVLTPGQRQMMMRPGVRVLPR